MKEINFNGFIRILSTFIILLLASLTSHGQDETSASVHSFYGGAGFTSNMVYMGTSISQDKPVYSGYLTYGFKDRLYLSAATYHLPAFDPLLAFHTTSLTWNQVINSWFDVSADVSGYLVAPSLTDTLFQNFVYGNLTLGFDWKLLYTRVSGGGVLSEGSGAYLQMRNSRYFQTPAFADGKAYISFDPYVNMLFGTLTRTITPEGTTIGISRPFGSGKSGGNSSQNTTDYFGLMQLDMGIPVSLNAGSFTLEAEPGYVFTLYSDTEVANPKGFIFMVNCYYKIF